MYIGIVGRWQTTNYKEDLRSSGTLRSVDWKLLTDVLGQPIGHIFKDQAKDRTERLSRNISNYQSILRNDPEERRSHFHCGGSLKITPL